MATPADRRWTMAKANGQAPEDSGIAARLPGYRLERQLASGNMGVVYLAEEIALRRRVAIKVLSPDLAGQDQFRQRFSRESELAAALHHPNIIPLHSAGESDGLLYLVMSYVDGPDLGRVLRAEGPFSLERTVTVIGQIAAALDAAHAAGLVHRDVKPANVLFDHGRGLAGADHVYLCDFGIAKQTATEGTLTATGQFVGTIDFVSPEQIQGKPVDGRADQYALGCLVFNCLTGTVPFPRQETTAALWAHLTEDPPLVTDHRPELPQPVNDVVTRMLAKEPEARYGTCAEVAAALEAVAFGGGAPPPIPAAPARPPARPPAAAAAPASAGYPSAPPELTPTPPVPTPAAGLASPAPILPPTAPPSAPPSPQDQAAPPPPAKSRSWLGVLMGVLGVLVALVSVVVVLFSSEPTDAPVAGTPAASPQEGAPAAEAPAAEAPAAGGVQALADHVPADLQAACEPAARGVGIAERVDCRPASVPASRVVYVRFEDQVAMDAFYDASVAELGGDACAVQPSDLRADGTYVRDGASLGRFECVVAGAGSTIVWTNDDLLIAAVASGENEAPLLTWWRNEAGPLP